MAVVVLLDAYLARKINHITHAMLVPIEDWLLNEPHARSVAGVNLTDMGADLRGRPTHNIEYAM